MCPCKRLLPESIIWIWANLAIVQQKHGLRPDVISYSATISACEKENQWQQPLTIVRVFEDLLMRKPRKSSKNRSHHQLRRAGSAASMGAPEGSQQAKCCSQDTEVSSPTHAPTRAISPKPAPKYVLRRLESDAELLRGSSRNDDSTDPRHVLTAFSWKLWNGRPTLTVEAGTLE